MDNYKDTAHRMYKDVQILHSNNSWYNTCYLAGYVIECYAKLIIDNAITNGKSQARSTRQYSHDINRMSCEIINNISVASPVLVQYCLDLNQHCPHILSKWDPLKRYDSMESIWNQEQMANNFKEEIEKVIQQIKNMELDGVI